MTRLILIRHGLTDWNAKKKYCGSSDIKIDRKGARQARRIGTRLRNQKIDKIYSSDRKRAMQTARIIFCPAAKIHKSAALREMNFGIFESLTYHRIMQLYPVIYKKWLRDPFETAIPKAEHLKNVEKRVVREIEHIVATNAGKTVAIVCHGGVISVFLNHITKSNNFWKFIPDSASLTFVEFNNKGKARLKIFNDTSHLSRAQKSKNSWRDTKNQLKDG